MKSVAQKLGWKAGKTAIVVGRPPDVLIENFEDADAAAADIMLYFVSDAEALGQRLPSALAFYSEGKSLWFAYPKKSGKLKTDLSRDNGWGKMPEAGLLPVTQISIDDNWSALRFRLRSEIKVLTRKSDIPGGKH